MSGDNDKSCMVPPCSADVSLISLDLELRLYVARFVPQERWGEINDMLASPGAVPFKLINGIACGAVGAFRRLVGGHIRALGVSNVFANFIETVGYLGDLWTEDRSEPTRPLRVPLRAHHSHPLRRIGSVWPPARLYPRMLAVGLYMRRA